MDQDPANAPREEQPRFELLGDGIKSESVANSPTLLATVSAPSSKSPSQVVPSTEAPDTLAPAPAKKKGTAAAVKKAPKRPKTAEPKRGPKRVRASDGGPRGFGSDSDSDNGPYCLCRGPDDHRWMICCEKCEDWFHGECIKMDKEIGENLIEKYVCPNCTTEKLVTIYKKTCALWGCKKPARLSQTQPSVFCSVEHAQVWWERMLSRLPKAKAKADLSDQLTQGEFMAILSSGLAEADEAGVIKLSKVPFSDKRPDEGQEDEAGKSADKFCGQGGDCAEKLTPWQVPAMAFLAC